MHRGGWLPCCDAACHFAQSPPLFIYSIFYCFFDGFFPFPVRKAAKPADFQVLFFFPVDLHLGFPENFFDKSFRQNAEIHCFPRIFAQIFFFSFVQFV